MLSPIIARTGRAQSVNFVWEESPAGAIGSTVKLDDK